MKYEGVVLVRTILAFFAHPDDEGFGVGGTLARYASEGDRVILVCATAGEEGVNRLDEHDTADPSPGSTTDLGEVRREELRRACDRLGIEGPVFLGYRDSGMVDEPFNEHPDSLHQADLDEVAHRIATIIRDERADAVVTFEQYGWYGHPDHVKVYQAVRRAFEMLDLIETPLLYLSVMFPAEMSRHAARMLEEAGEEVPRIFSDEERQRYRLETIPVVVDTTDLVDQKVAALNEHRTQVSAEGVQSRFPEALFRMGISREYFLPAVHHDALPRVLPFDRSGGLFGEPPPEPLVPYPV